MEVIPGRRKRGLNTTGLRTWGLLFVALGAVSVAVIQNGILGLNKGNDLLTVLERSPELMTYATAAVVMQAMETCAVPIFAFLLTEGMENTADPKKYLIRILTLAVVSEIPYNLAFSGKLLDFSSRNPVLGVAFAMIVLWFCNGYQEKKFKNFLIRMLVMVCGMLWCGMLNVAYGGTMVLISYVLWAYRHKPYSYRLLAGSAATILCSISHMLFIAAPMGFLPILFYNDEEGDSDRKVNYGAYPVILLITLAAGIFLF
jgi:hypothetical protein